MVLPTNREEFALTLDELQELPSTFSDPSYVPQVDLEPHLIQQSRLNDLHEFNLSKQQAELLASGLQQCNLLAKETRISLLRKRHRKFSRLYRMYDSDCR
jgi:hypothetical protein